MSVPGRLFRLSGASPEPLRVPAAILGMHTLMSNQQYYQALGSSSIVNKEGLNSEYLAPRPRPQPGHLGSEAPPLLAAPHSCSLARGRTCTFYVARSSHLFLLLSWDLCLIYKGLLRASVIKMASYVFF